MKNNDTLNLTINFCNNLYKIDTKIIPKYEKENILYIADSSKTPSKCELICYELMNTIDNSIVVYPKVFNYKTKSYEFISENKLFRTETEAIEEYLFLTEEYNS